MEIDQTGGNMKRGRNIIFCLFLMVVTVLPIGGVAQAAVITDFTGVFAPANWTTISTNSNGTSLTTIAFQFITGSDGAGAGAGTQEVSMPSPGNYQIDFDWVYSTSDSNASWDPAFYANDTWNTLITSGIVGAGHVTFLTSTGDTLGWKIESIDNAGGPAYLVITQFVATTIPEPGTLILLGSGLLGVALAASRKKFRK